MHRDCGINPVCVEKNPDQAGILSICAFVNGGSVAYPELV